MTPSKDESVSSRLSEQSPSSEALKPNRAPPRTACEACRRRKVKCSGDRPICQRCQRMNKQCCYTPNTSSIARYVTTLEKRIQELEETTRLSSGHPIISPFRSNPHSTNAEIVAIGRDATCTSPGSPVWEENRLGKALSDLAPRVPERRIAQLPSNEQLLKTLPHGLDLAHVSNRSVEKEELGRAVMQVDRSLLPSRAEIYALRDHYIAYSNSAFPIHNIPTLKRQIEDVCFATGQHSATCLDICVVLSVLSVAAKSLSRSPESGERLGRHHRSLWEASKNYVEDNDQHGQKTLARLQLALVRLQYVLHSPEAGNVWQLSGGAVRMAVDLGLHHDVPEVPGAPAKDIQERDMRSRLFWTAYCIDRNLSIALGRPPAIADDWITVQMPVSSSSSPYLDPRACNDNYEPVQLIALHHIRIRRLQSEIQQHLYASVGHRLQGAHFDDWCRSIANRIADWRESAPTGSGFCSSEWLDLNLHMTRIMLYRPSPGRPDPDKESLSLAFTAASGAMRTYKNMWRLRKVNYGWLAMYQIFVAGMTYLNSMFQAHRSGWSIVPSYVDALLDVQVCASVMEALSTLTTGTSDIRNAFESLSERIIRHLTSRAHWSSGPSSPMNDSMSFDSHAFPSNRPSQQQMYPPLYEPLDLQTMNQANTTASYEDTLSHTDLDGPSVETYPLLNMDNPLDPFLMQPLGEWSSADWDKALGNALFSLTE